MQNKAPDNNRSPVPLKFPRIGTVRKTPLSGDHDHIFSAHGRVKLYIKFNTKRTSIHFPKNTVSLAFIAQSIPRSMNMPSRHMELSRKAQSPYLGRSIARWK